MKKLQYQNTALILIFCLVLMVPALDSAFHFSPVKDLFEKRQQVQKPALPTSFDDLKTYPRQYEAFFNDNYGFRKTLIFWHSKMMDKLFNQSPMSRVVIGKEDWLYFDNKNSLLDAQGAITLDPQLINRGVKAFAQNWQQLQSENIDYLLVIAADKSSIYPEFLPDYITYNTKNHRIDQFLTALKQQYPDFPVLDLRPILLQAKQHEIIYHQTDTHWNARGAHYAYVEMMNKLGIKPYLRDKFDTIIGEKRIHGDISIMMGSRAKNIDYTLSPIFKIKSRYRPTTSEEKKSYHKPVAFKTKNKKLPRLFAYQDSFFGELHQFVPQHFAHSFLINEHPCQISLEVIKKYNSNVVIQQFWEGRVQDILNRCK